MITSIEALLEYDQAGDPMTGLRWTRRTTVKIAHELKRLGIDVCPNTVAQLLRQLGFSLRVNHKKLSRRSDPDRDEQFGYIAEQRERFARDGQPIISIDTKKKELIGHFKNPGRAWSKKPIPVNTHDFRSDADGRAVPNGIYDIGANRGTLYIGTSYDTPEFAADGLARWWREVPIPVKSSTESGRSLPGVPEQAFHRIQSMASSRSEATLVVGLLTADPPSWPGCGRSISGHA